MAAPMRNVENEKKNTNICKIEATAVTGFEFIVAEEVFEKFGIHSTINKGHVVFLLPIEGIQQIYSLHSVENLYVVMNSFEDIKLSGKEEDKQDDVQLLADTIPETDWETGLKVWKQFFPFKYKVSPTPVPMEDLDSIPLEEEQPSLSDFKQDDLDLTDLDKASSENNETLKEVFKDDDNSGSTRPCENENFICNESQKDGNSDEKSDKLKIPTLPSYRVTCYRNGKKHSFSSMDAAAHYGGIINDTFLWNVDLKNFDIEIVLKIDNANMRVSLALTRQSLAKRHISHFGPTSLKATNAYCMLRMCDIKDGDVVCDPMCGGGSIPIEAAVCWPKARHICGDIHKMAYPRTLANIEAINERRKAKGRLPLNIDVFEWDATNLPLKDQSVDVMAIDLPFGKKSGSKYDNRRLYPAVMSELARVTKRSTGRACLLTFDKRNMIRTLNLMQNIWHRVKTIGINMGGLATGVFLVSRTAKTLNKPLLTNQGCGKRRKLDNESAVETCEHDSDDSIPKDTS